MKVQIFLHHMSDLTKTWRNSLGHNKDSESLNHIILIVNIVVMAAKQHLILSKKEGNDQESIQSSKTPDPGYQWESDNFTIRHHKQEPRGLPFPSW